MKSSCDRRQTHLFLPLLIMLLIGATAGCANDPGPGMSGGDGGRPDKGIVCGPGATVCDGQCVNLSSNPSHCGVCGTACKAGEVCSGGKCALSCQTGLTDCSGACVNTDSDPKNCGACGTACQAGEVCSAGKCALSCPPPQKKCGGGDAGPPYCANVQSDNSNCGACGTACQAGEVCSAGKCALTCQTGLTECSGKCVDTLTDLFNCGACAAACKAGEVCSAGKCALTCQSGLTDCSGKCVDTLTDWSNCGACATPCKAGQLCSAGKCALSCQSGLTDCSGQCVNLKTDQYNCGACGTACKLGTYCCAGGCVDPTTNASHCGGCNKACATGYLCQAAKCVTYGLSISALGCRYVDVKNTGDLPLTSFTVTVAGATVPATAPSGGIAAGSSGRIYLAYVVTNGQAVVVTAHGASATSSQAATCTVRLGFAQYGDQGGDELAFIRSINDVGADFTTRTGLVVTTKTKASTACAGLTTTQVLTNVDTEDLTDLDLLYYHSHNTTSIGTVFKPTAATQTKLLTWVTNGGLLIFDDCGGMTSADLTSGFGITVGLNGSTGSSSTASSFTLSSDIYAAPYAFTTTTFSTTAAWTEGGQTSLTGGLKEVVHRGSSALLSAKKVGNGWVAFMGGDWGCSLACGCSAGTKVGHQLLMNFAYVAAGRGKLIK